MVLFRSRMNVDVNKKDPMLLSITEEVKVQNDEMSKKIDGLEAQISTLLRLVNDIHVKVNVETCDVK